MICSQQVVGMKSFQTGLFSCTLLLLAFAEGAISRIFAQTRFEPRPDDPRIIAVIEGRKRLNAAPATGNVGTVDALLAPDVVVNSPINRVVDRANVLGRVRSSEIRQPETAVNIEFAGVRGELVVSMGGNRASCGGHAERWQDRASTVY
jgi:hypothetical protein